MQRCSLILICVVYPGTSVKQQPYDLGSVEIDRSMQNGDVRHKLSVC
jgi:hypothetical protein